MKCPYCGYQNLEGEDSCESCGGDLMSIDVEIIPQSELERCLMEEKIADVPPPKPICLSGDTSIYEAARHMNQEKIGCILVTEGDRLVGIVSERDILYKSFLSVDTDLTQVPISTIMTPNPESLHGTDTVAYALNRMSLGGYRHIPIMKSGKAIGLASVTNLLKYITQRLPATVK